MNKASVIKDINTQELYGAVIHDGKSEAIAIPHSLKSLEWAAWLNDSKASFNDVKAVLDVNLQQEHSVDIDRHFVKTIEEQYGNEIARKVELYIPGDQFVQDGKTHPTMGTSIRRKSLSGVARTNLYSTPLHLIDEKDRQAALNFKARRFRTEQKVTSLNIQVKRVRAVFDANIGPGGGWRCPDGTLNGGQITDRFGRGCGGGLTRRIGRALMRAGQRLDEAGAGRDARRLARRTQAAVNRRERGERVREGRRAVANRLDAAADRLVGDFAPGRPAEDRGRGRTPSARRPRRDLPTRGMSPRDREVGGRRDQRRSEDDLLNAYRFDENGNLVRRDGPANEILPGGEVGRRWADMDDAELEEAFARNELQKPPTDGRVGFRPESELEQRRKRENQAAIRAEQAFRRGEGDRRPAGGEDTGEADAPEGGRAPGRRPGRQPSEQRPVRPRRPQGERQPATDGDVDRPTPSESDDPFDFIQDPDERERVKEALGPWAQVLADLIRDRRREDGRDGTPRPRRERRGAERGEESEEQRSLMQKIMDFFAKAIQRLGEFRERRGESRERRRERRNERRRQIARALDDAATRVLQEEGKPKRRRRGTERGTGRTDVNDRARDAAERVVPDEDERSRWRKEVNRQWREERGIPDDLKELNDNELDAIQEVVQGEEDQFNDNPDTFDMFVEERRRNLGRLKAERRRRERRKQREEAAVPTAEPSPEAAEPAGRGLGDLSDDQILDELANFIRGDEFPFDLQNLSDEELSRLDRIVADNNGPRQRLRDRNRMAHPAAEQIGFEVNRRQNLPDATPEEGSVPDERSLRNVRNRFPRRGLPQSAYWRDRNRPGYDRDEQRSMDERFSRYYDSDGNINDRGRYINDRLREEQTSNRRPLDAEERERIETDANRQFDRENPDQADAPDSAAQRRALVDQALADNPAPPEDFGDQVRSWRDQANIADLNRAFQMYRERGRALERVEAQLRFAGNNDEADEIRARRRMIAIAQRQAAFAAEAIDPDWNPDQDMNVPDARDVDVPEFGSGSEPDERSFRNVWNAFRQRGLPARPTWRDRGRQNYSEERERSFDRRFGRYYDANGDLNERGRYVNRKLRERREAEGRALTENEVAQVVALADAEQQERELSAPPVPDAVPAQVEGDDIWRQDLSREEVQDALSGDAFNRVRDIVDRLERSGGGPDTPNEIQELIDEANRINGLMRRIQARFEANNASRISLADDQLAELENVYLELDRARRAMVPDSFRQFRDIDSVKVNVNGVVYNEGIFHPMFDDNREDFFRAHYAIPNGINAIIADGNGREDEALAEVVSFVNQEWLDQGGALGPEDFGQLVGLTRNGWDGLDATKRRELMRNLAMASHSRDRIDDYLKRQTGLSLSDAGRMASLAVNMKNYRDQLQAARTALYNRTVPASMAQTLDGRITQMEALAESYVAVYQSMLQLAGNGRLPDGDAGDFLGRLGQVYGRDRTLVDGQNPNLFNGTTPDSLRGYVRRVNEIARLMRDIGFGQIGESEPTDNRRLNDISRILSVGPMAFANGGNPPLDPADRFLGEVVALSMARTALTRQHLEARQAAIRNRWGYPNEPDANLAAQRNVNEPNGVVNGVQDVISTDSEAAQLIDNILENAQRKRRRSLTAVFRKKYPNETGNPWDNYKRRNGGSHPFSADTITDDYANGTPEQRRKIKEWLKNAYEVEVDGPQGTKARTKVSSVEWTGGQLTVSGRTTLVFADGREVDAGSMTRQIKTDGRIYSALFTIGTESQDWDMITGRRVSKRGNKWVYSDTGQPLPENHHTGKGMGLATAVNGHSWGWLKDAGFKEVGVSPAWDGPYIWGRVGYRGSSRDIQRVWQNAANEVLKYRRGDTSIVKTEDQARMITELARRANANNYSPASSPAQMELIYALEHGSTDRNRTQRINAVRTWIRSNTPIGGSTLYLDNHSFDAIDESNEPQDVQLNRRGVDMSGGTMLRGLVRPQPADARRGQIATPVVSPGDLPEPRVITNASIKSPEQAVNFLRNGGSLNDVPNEYWIPAIQGNASRTEVDPGSMFFEKPPRDGNMADTRIFLLRDENGRPTNQGLVIKGSRPNRVGQGYMDDVYAEVAGYNLAAAVGLMPEGAGYVGTATLAPRAGRGVGDEEVFVVIPHAANLAPGNGALNRGAADYDPRIMANAPQRGLPARTAHFFHNFFLGAADRHNKNGGTFIDENGNAIVVPYDQGRIAVSGYAAIPRYAWLGPDASVGRYKFPMDSQLFTEMQDYVRSVSRREATRFRREMLERYDEMVTRYRSAISGGRDEFIRRMSIGAPDTVGGRDVRSIRVQRLGEIYDHLKAKVDRAEEHKNYLKSKLSIPRGNQ